MSSKSNTVALCHRLGEIFADHKSDKELESIIGMLISQNAKENNKKWAKIWTDPSPGNLYRPQKSTWKNARH